jgi:hypothetical protein
MKFTHRTSRAIGLVAISTALSSGALRAANNLFVGDWKLDPSRSKLTDVMKVERLSSNKNTFDFGVDSPKTHCHWSRPFVPGLLLTPVEPLSVAVDREDWAAPVERIPDHLPRVDPATQQVRLNYRISRPSWRSSRIPRWRKPCHRQQ